MKDAGRLSAAIEVLSDVEVNHRPLQDSLKDWGRSHRFAGSGDRVAIGNLVFDAMRRRSSLGWIMDDSSARAVVLATYAVMWGQGGERLQEVMTDDKHAPAPLTESEITRLAAPNDAEAPEWVRADVPQWLWPYFTKTFGADALVEAQALASRAPIDLRVNRLKSNREKVLKRLAHLKAEPCASSPNGVRIQAPSGAGRLPHIQAEEGFRKGWFELQDEASQIAALMAQACAGEQVFDICAGGGGKTLALASDMGNRGQIYAYDSNRLRLAPIYERLSRAGVRNIQVQDPKTSDLSDLVGKMDLVFVDVPCTGTGVWRRRPDSKWRLSENALAGRQEEQARVLREAASFVRPGGRLIYATCSLLPLENEDQVRSFIAQDSGFCVESLEDVFNRSCSPDAPSPRISEEGFLTLSPARTRTDGFFTAMLRKAAS